MNFDPGILVYLIFLAIILYSNHLKKRKQAQQREAQAHEARAREAQAHETQPRETAVLQTKVPPQPVRAKPARERPRAEVLQAPAHAGVRRQPIEAARFKTRDDIRRAVVARVVLAPPKGLE